MISFHVKNDRTKEIKSEMERALLVALEKCGEIGEGYAKDNLTQAHHVDTGNLRNLCNSNGWIEDKVISAIERGAKELGLKADKFISSEISIYAAGQTDFGSRQETVAEVFSKLNGKDAAIAEKIFKEAGVI